VTVIVVVTGAEVMVMPLVWIPALASAAASVVAEDSDEDTDAAAEAAVGPLSVVPTTTATVTCAVTTGAVALAEAAPPAVATDVSIAGACRELDTAAAVDAEPPSPETVMGTEKSSSMRRRAAAPSVTLAVVCTAAGSDARTALAMPTAWLLLSVEPPPTRVNREETGMSVTVIVTWEMLTPEAAATPAAMLVVENVAGLMDPSDSVIDTVVVVTSADSELGGLAAGGAAAGGGSAAGGAGADAPAAASSSTAAGGILGLVGGGEEGGGVEERGRSGDRGGGLSVGDGGGGLGAGSGLGSGGLGGGEK
jgi:hypothetical protein